MPEVRRPLVVVSNRGPLSFTFDDAGVLVTKRAGGGLVSALGPALAGTDARWIAAALSDADRQAAATGNLDAEGFHLQPLVVDPDDYRAYYDVISSGTLWFLHHNLYDTPRRPRFDRHWRLAWDAYRKVNAAFAAAVIETAPDGALVGVHDFHLCLLGPELAAKRPDLTTWHFHHTPFASPEVLAVLPVDVAEELMEGLSAFGACGFHDERWATAFEAGCRQVLGAEPPPTFVTAAAVDAEDIATVARSKECEDAGRDLDEEIGDRAFIVRVDRIELSKNLLRGFWAYDELLRHRPEWRGRVTFGAFVYPSREGLAEYIAYRVEVEGLIARINEEWGTPHWLPIVYHPGDDFARSLAALRRYDVLLVNPVRDGLNLVAKEGPLVNERDGVLALSRTSGAWSELGHVALGIDAFDVSGTAEVLHQALSMAPDDRATHAAAARAVAQSRTPADWLADQVTAVRGS